MHVASYILIFGVMAALGVSVVWALWWAIHSGQFDSLERASSSIFDEEEPVGLPTDRFPTSSSTRPPPQGERL
jgi:cbb3-type cytochrome oxidase maturation protein